MRYPVRSGTKPEVREQFREQVRRRAGGQVFDQMSEKLQESQ